MPNKKKRYEKPKPPPEPKHPWTLKDKAWGALLALIVIVPVVWALTVTGGLPPAEQDMTSALYGQMSDLRSANPSVLSWSMEEWGDTLSLELIVSDEATKEEIERWSVYFLETAKGTVGLVTEYEYELGVTRRE